MERNDLIRFEPNEQKDFMFWRDHSDCFEGNTEYGGGTCCGVSVRRHVGTYAGDGIFPLDYHPNEVYSRYKLSYWAEKRNK